MSSWDSKKEDVGAVSQEIVKLTKNQKIETKLRFTKPFESGSDSNFILSKTKSNQTQVKWGLKGSFPYTMNVFFAIY